MERIKHFFDHEDIIFVFSVNVNELTNTISNYYGQNFDSHRYLNKFFDFSIDLPQIDITNFMNFLGLEKDSNWFNETVFEFINHYHFTMRDCIRYRQALKVVEEYVNSSSGYHFKEENGKGIINMFFIPILLGIKIIDLKSYIEIIKGNGLAKFLEIISRLEVPSEGLSYYMDKNQEGKISEESFKKQLFEIYNAIFNHKEYSNNKIELNRYSYNYIMDVLSLLKKDLKY